MFRFPSGLRATIWPLLGLFLACGSAHAATYTGNSSTGYNDQGECVTIGSDNGDFDDARNWGSPCSPGSVPGSDETVDLAGHNVHGTTVNVEGLQTNGGTLTADSITLNDLIMNGGGGISGRDATDSTLTVNDSVSWTGGALSTVTATFGPNCTATISGTDDKFINGSAMLNNQGALTWSGKYITGTPGTLNNTGTFNLAADGNLNNTTYGSGITIINSGTLVKTAGTGTTGMGVGGSFTENGGTLGAQSGVLDLSGITGNGNGPTKLNGDITIASGAGVVQQSDGYLVNGNFTVNGTWRITGGGSVGTATFSGPGHIDWQGGGFGDDYYDSSGTHHHSNFVLAAGFRADMSGTSNHAVGVLTNLGTINWKGPGNVGGGTLTNKGTFNLLTDGPLGNWNGGLTPGIINTGTIAKTGGTGVTNTSYHYLDNSGTIDIQHGTIQLDGNPSGGNDVFRNGTIIKGAGKLVTTTTAFCSGTITVDGTFDVSSDVRSNSDTSTATFKGAGSLEWHSGGLGGVNIAPGFTVNASGTGGKALTTSNALLSGKPDSNAGTFNWKGGSTITIYGNFTNTGTLNMVASGYVFVGTILNKGTFTAFPGGSNSMNGAFTNMGVLNLGSQAKPGTFAFYDGYGPGFTTTGTINAFIAGTKASQLQALSDANSATTIKLGGKLAIALASGTKPTAVQQFVLVKVFPNRAEYSQKFASVTGLPTVSGRAMQLFYHPMDVTLGTPLTVSGRAVRWVLSSGTLVQQGVSGATVNLAKTNGATVTATTNSTGNFVFKGLELGSYTASASKSGITFDPLSTKFALPTSGATSSPDSVLVFQTYSVTGKVVDPAGKPVSGVTFTLSNSAASRTAATNTKGEALFSDLGAASFTLTPTAQSGFTFVPTKAAVKVPTTGTHNVSPNAVVSFTRTPKTSTQAVSGSSSAGEG